ncbi:AEC family transporter [Marinobacter daepoensis]|uniref:AEC family transporter n=1 Tax=Marinobacter daepoensis TaxID=262077 RepID=A0ABS3BCH6_9GAMM|nr:AEC family transporter [Marinobacter daepoensis]MBN7769523.1 AEC family transporter [Marinobacter daepoensis]MBY6078213.1 AEC family transporter [Marinobacter daepoensis]
MPVVVQALIPVFVLIILGHGLRRADFPGGDFWPRAERFTYYVLFPAMLVFKLGQARLPPSAYGDTALLIITMLVAMTLVLTIAQWFWKWSGPVFSSVYQGGIRFNSYVGLAAGGMLLGDEGLSLTAIAVAIMVPLLNLLCILMFSLVAERGRINLAGVFRAIVTNPLIVGSVIGVLWSYFQIGFHPLLAGILEPLSNLALPMGLMTVGAGLQLSALRGSSGPFLVSSALKLLVFPLLAAALAWMLGLEGLLVQVVVLLAALPTATSAYILARQLGGDAPLMAGIISGQTLLAMVSIPLMLSLLW